MVRPVERRCNSEASLTRWASPPDSVGAGWPRRTYPRPTSVRVSRWRWIAGIASKKAGGFLDRHVQHVGDGFAFVVHGQGVGVVPGAVAHLARHVHIRQELHLDLDRAVPGARLAPAALDVEGEPARLVAADLRLGGRREQLPHMIEHPGVGGRVRAGGPPDRPLVHVHHLVQLAHPRHPDMPARHRPRPMQLPRQRVIQNVVDQRRLPRPRHPRHRDERAQRERHIHILQIVLTGPLDHDLAGLRPLAADRRYRDLLPAGQVRPGHRLGAGQEVAPRSRRPRPSRRAHRRPGPMSTTQSAARMVSSSCSTTISVLPRSRSRIRVSSSRWLSR